MGKSDFQFSVGVGVSNGTPTLEVRVKVAQKPRVDLPHDPFIPLLNIYPKSSTISYYKLKIYT